MNSWPSFDVNETKESILQFWMGGKMHTMLHYLYCIFVTIDGQKSFVSQAGKVRCVWYVCVFVHERSVNLHMYSIWCVCLCNCVFECMHAVCGMWCLFIYLCRFVGCEECVVYMVGGICAWAFVMNACAELLCMYIYLW